MSPAFVTSGDDGVLRVLRSRPPRLLRTTAVPRGSYNVQASGGTVVTPSLTEGTVCLLDDRGRVYVRERIASLVARRLSAAGGLADAHGEAARFVRLRRLAARQADRDVVVSFRPP